MQTILLSESGKLMKIGGFALSFENKGISLKCMIKCAMNLFHIFLV